MQTNLDQPLMTFPLNQGHHHWTIRDAVQGLAILGSNGSGKTSGSGRTLALKYLSAKFGGIVLTAKADERALWEEYCALSGRTNDLIVIEPNGKYKFNFLEYESSGKTDRVATDNIVEVLKTVIRASETISTGKNDDAFWESALDMLLFNTIDLCRIAFGRITVEDIYKIVQAIPRSHSSGIPENKSPKQKEGAIKSEEDVNSFVKAYHLAHEKVNEEIAEWANTFSSTDYEKMKNSGQLDWKILDEVPNARLFRQVETFFFDNYLTLSEKTRSIIDFSFSGFLFRLLREPIYSTFCKHPSNITPEDCLEGKIILIDLPVKTYNKVGRDSQIMLKYIWQRAMEKRDIRKNDRPVFLWADEAQHFLHEFDAIYQATARSSRIATVYISQNLPNYYANMGGAKAEYRVKSFLGTLGTKIFHANADFATNQYSSELIGDGLFEDMSRSTNMGDSFGASKSQSLKIDKKIRPEDFAQLRTGGPKNNFKVEGIIHLQGIPLVEGDCHTLIIFNQNYNSKTTSA